MLSNEIAFVVHGYVKAIPKDVVMMYVATPEDGNHRHFNHGRWHVGTDMTEMCYDSWCL